jgi:hypothetical protein
MLRICIRSIWSKVPVPVVSVKRLPGRLVGISLGAAVLVRDDYRDDWPTVVHELEHCKQFWRRGMLLHFVRYYANRNYRLDCELEAFGAELAACNSAERGHRLDDAARSLATGYRIGLDARTCRRLLQRRIGGFAIESAVIPGTISRGWRIHRALAARVRAR